MKYTLERISQPELEPVALDEMRRHLRVDQTDTDTDITGLIVAAREWVEDYTGRALIAQDWRLTLHGRHGSFAGGDIISGTRDGALPVSYGFYHGFWKWGLHGEILLMKAPVLAITKFVSVDAVGIETDIDPATYELREKIGKWPRLVALNGANWSAWMTGDLRIEYRAGFAERLGSPQQGPEVVPFRFKAAMKLWAEAIFDRDPVMMPLLLKAAENLIEPECSELRLA